MNTILLFYYYSTFLVILNAQVVQYANRFRNFSVESETDSVYLVKMKIFQNKHEHKLSVAVNITKDVHIKNIQVVLHRCNFEKSDCENYQKWHFADNLKSVVYMKNQMWTPILDHITPKPDIPYLKKNFYQSPDVNFDTKAIVTFYPEVVNYFWRADAILNDYKEKLAIAMKFEFVIFPYVERNIKRPKRIHRLEASIP